MAHKRIAALWQPQLWLGVVIVCTLALQVAVGVVVQVWREARLWRSGPSVEHRDAFLSFVAAHVTRGDTVLYVTRGADSEASWNYFRLSYELYPSEVWWVTPVPRTSAVDWWISASLDGPSLLALGTNKGARWLVADGVEPSGIVGRRWIRHSAQRSIVDLGGNEP